METSIEEILTQICNEYNQPKKQIEPIIEKLNMEFYYKLKDVKNLSNEKWKEFKLPDNLYNLLIERFNKENIIAKYEISTPVSIEITNKGEIKTHSQDVTNYQLTKKEIDDGLNEIDSEITDVNKQREVLGLIEGVVLNVINHPSEEKYRKINFEKIRKKYPYQSIGKFFNLIKFRKIAETDQTFIRYSKEVNWLANVVPLMYEHYHLKYDKSKNATNTLRQCLKRSNLLNKWISQGEANYQDNQAKTETSDYNPSVTSSLYTTRGDNTKQDQNNMQSINEENKTEEPVFLAKYRQKKQEEQINQQLDEIHAKEKMENKTIRELINDEHKRRDIIVEKAVLVRMPKCYYLANSKNYQTLQKKYYKPHQYIPKDEDIQLFQNQKELMRKKENEGNKHDVEELQRLINTAITVGHDIFFVFPDNYVLQGTFCLHESTSELYNFIRKFIHNPRETFYLKYLNSKINETQESINSLKLGFPLRFDVVFPIIYCKLKDEEIEKLKVNII